MASIAPTRMQILVLYKQLMLEARKLPSYNFRSYALRRIQDAFNENKNITDSKEKQKLYEYGVENLQIIRRQVIIQHLYQTEKLVIEQKGD